MTAGDGPAPPPVVVATASYAYLRDRVADAGEWSVGRVERRSFPDGEHYRRLTFACADRDVVLIGGTVSAEDTLELYDLACGAVYYGARTLTLVVPFFGYSTMERAELSGEVVTAKTRARLLSSVPPAARGNRVILLDLHAPGVTHYFEGHLRPVHISARAIVERAARRLGGDGFVLGCTDAGRAKWVESLAHNLEVTPAFVYKRRLSGDRTEVAGVNAYVKDKPVVIYDDMIRTGGSLLGAARAYLDAGATRVAAIATHGIFPGAALEEIRRSGLVSALVCTDSHPRAVELASAFLRVDSVAGLIADEVKQRGIRDEGADSGRYSE